MSSAFEMTAMQRKQASAYGKGGCYLTKAAIRPNTSDSTYGANLPRKRIIDLGLVCPSQPIVKI
jgi:hypothetical protein